MTERPCECRFVCQRPATCPRSTRDELGDALARLRAGLDDFEVEMREQGIHVGMGNPARCVTCNEPWPCVTSVRAVRPAP
jgi:hypothetical protein